MNRFSLTESVWIALSDLFVDTELSYEYIARRVAHLDVKVLELILYLEVAPICIGNMLTPIPLVWSGFDEEALVLEIEKHLQKLQNSGFYRVQTRFKVIFYKGMLHSEWSKVVAEIHLAQAKHVS